MAMTSRYNRTQDVFETLPPMGVRRGEQIVAIAAGHRTRATRMGTDQPTIHLHPDDMRDLTEAAWWRRLQLTEPEKLTALFGMPIEPDDSTPRGEVRLVDSYPITVDTSEDVED
jgi:hypothetical protein